MGSVIELSDVLFYVFAALAVAGAGGVAFSRNIVYSAFSLLLALFGVGAVYVFLSADLLAVVQLLVYIGGVLVLILFAIMLTSQIGSAEGTNPVVAVIPASGLFALGTLILVYAAASMPWGEIAGAGLPVLQNAGLEPTAAKVGNALLTDYLLPFEIASVVLLAALIGAVIIARKEMRVLKPSQGGAAKSSALAVSVKVDAPKVQAEKAEVDKTEEVAS